jgi:hypothetical protein
VLTALTLGGCKPQPVPEQGAAPEAATREQLGIDFLLGTAGLKSPLPTSAYMPPETAQAPANRLEGVLEWLNSDNSGLIEVLVDDFNLAIEDRWQIRQLPPFRFEYVQTGKDLVPVRRGPQPGEHPYWEFILEPGKAWNEAADRGWSRASLPFSLQERNQNCTHNGMLSFLFKSSGEISRVAYQVVSETCKYMKINLWGVTDAHFRPAVVAGREEVIGTHVSEFSGRLPVRPFTELEIDYPGADMSALTPPGLEHVSVFGFVIDGVHYRGGCKTRFGPYPYCDVLDVPSYSTAKSVFAGPVFLYLEQTWPGFADSLVTDWVPECRLADDRWNGVSLRHLLNMNTGLYDSAEFNADEDAAETISGFFLAESHAGKIRFACHAYAKKSPPGERFVYHTSDTYLLGTAMNAFLRARQGPDADIHRDVLVGKFWQPLDLSAVARTTRRTYDDEAQPFTGYGLTFHPDDVARIGQFLNAGISREEGPEILTNPEFRHAMFRDVEDVRLWQNARGQTYNSGFWGLDTGSAIGCSEASWVPFMSGFGGISLVLLPNQSVYYVFGDNNEYKWLKAAVAAHNIRAWCKEPTR